MIRTTLVTVCALSLIALGGCSSATDVWKDAKPGQLKVLASFPPIYCFAANVAGDQATVLCLLTGQGPHHYNASHLDSLKVVGADLFLANGLELDDFATRLARMSGNRNKELVFKLGDALDHDMLIHLDESERVHYHEDGSQCIHGEHDPHIWLSPTHASAMVKEIAKKLGALDAPHQKAYDDNAAAYIKELETLRDYGLEKFKDKKNRRIVSTHDSLRYFAGAFGLEVVGSIQAQPGVEADAGKLGAIADACRAKKVNAILVEPQYSQGAAESLKKHLKRRENLDVQTVLFDPLETAAAGPNGNPDPGLYLAQMKRNIDNLAKALE